MPSPITSTTALMVKDATPLQGPQYLNPNGGTPQFEFLQGAYGGSYATILDANGNVLFSSSNPGTVNAPKTAAAPNHIASIPYTSLTGTSYTATISTSRNAIQRAIVIFNSTNASFSSVNFAFYDSALPAISGFQQSGASDSWQPNGSLAANTYSVFSSRDDNGTTATGATILGVPLNQMLVKVAYSTAPTSGTLDIWLVEQL